MLGSAQSIRAALRGEILSVDLRSLAAIESRLSRSSVSPKAPPVALSSVAGGAASKPYAVVDRVAHLPLEGVLMRGVPHWFAWCGVQATDVDDFGAAFAMAIEDHEVDVIVIDADSPGGAISGIEDLSAKVFEGRTRKPVHGHIHEIAASACLWVLASVDHISATPGAFVGSIGVFTTLDDSTQAFAKNGVTRHLVSSGGIKGQGEEGTPVTEELKAAEQDLIDQTNALFIGALARGRGLDLAAASKLATGHLWPAAKAASLGLIDSIVSADAAHAAAREISTVRTLEAAFRPKRKGSRK